MDVEGLEREEEGATMSDTLTRKKKKIPIKDVVLHMQANRAGNITIEQLTALAYTQGLELVIQFKAKEAQP